VVDPLVGRLTAQAVDPRGELVITAAVGCQRAIGQSVDACQHALRRSWDDPGVTTRRVAWRRSDDVETDEHCTLILRDGGLSLVGTVIGAEGGLPTRVEYRVLADRSGLTTAVHVRDLRGFETRTITLERNAKGSWTVDGAAARGLRGCTDIDLGCSPSTNTLPIRRLRLAIGASHTIRAAWVRFPELTVVKAAQTYTRLDELSYRYASGSFAAELTADEDGLVAEYAEWRRTGFAVGPDDTEPLDARG
jgi:uncharacterized protein